MLTLLLSLLLYTQAPAKPATSPAVSLSGGSMSSAYHKTDKCRGFTNCSTQPRKVKFSEAKKQNRRPCGWCYFLRKSID